MTTFESANTTFLAWLSANGATVADFIALHDYSADGAGRGVVVLTDISKDQELFSIPRSLLLSPDTSALSQKMDLSSLQGWNPLVMCLIYEDGLGVESTWKPYFDVLPQKFSTPMFWSDNDLKELAGTGVIDKVGKAETETLFKEALWPLIQANPSLFLDRGYDHYLATFHRMGSLIMAYAFHDEIEEEDNEEDEDEDEEEKEGKVVVSMVPMADMLNHKTGHNNARLFHEKDRLRMVSIKPIKAGQQIYNTYGDLCNADLLRKYGFVDSVNPFNIAEISGESVVEACTAQDPVGKEEKIEWLVENDGLEEYIVVEADGEIPDELVGCAKILMMPLEEFKTTVIEGKKLPSTKLTAPVQKVLQELLEARIALYSGDSKTDKAFLKQEAEASLRSKRNAVIVRTGERDILLSVLDKVKKWKPPTPVPASASGKQKVPPKGQHHNKGKKPYQRK
ncbi:hypothetical protein BGZ94_009640 [Podila epigama]|nr:hypothetical protein BGZ94_009640 [Podila epigama]